MLCHWYTSISALRASFIEALNRYVNYFNHTQNSYYHLFMVPL